MDHTESMMDQRIKGGVRNVTMDDVVARMAVEIALAQFYDPESRKAKDLMFCPASLKYIVRSFDGSDDHMVEYYDPLIAIEVYNKS